MSQLITGSICLSDIPREKITTSKNGKKYLSVAIWINDNPDKLGNDTSIQVSQSKEEREAKNKTIYIGNGKVQGKKNVINQQENKQQNHPQFDDAVDDLPF